MDDPELLMREASLASQCLGAGLSSIGKYNFSEKGYFYNGLFGICIGVERVCKLAILMDYSINNSGRYPDNKYLKSMGHNLDQLIQKMRNINRDRHFKIDETLFSDSLIISVIAFLTEFANQSRYYNLDTIVGRRNSDAEPMEKWDKDIIRCILGRHVDILKVVNRKLVKLPYPNSLVAVLHIDEGGRNISTPKEFMIHSLLVNEKQRYSRKYLYVIVNFCSRVMCEFEFKCGFQSNINELFTLFISNDKNIGLNRKRWDPYRL